MAAGVPGHRFGHAFDVFEHALNAPEAAAGKDRRLRTRTGRRHINRRRRQRSGRILGLAGISGTATAKATNSAAPDAAIADRIMLEPP